MNVLVVLPEDTTVMPPQSPGLKFMKLGNDIVGCGFDLIVVPNSVAYSEDPTVQNWLNFCIRPRLYRGGQIVIAGS